MLEKIQARGDCPILENVVPSDGAKYGLFWVYNSKLLTFFCIQKNLEEFLKEIFNSVNERVGLVNSGSMKLVNGHQKLGIVFTSFYHLCFYASSLSNSAASPNC